ncbi:MAG TPA: glutamyl-tRNA reductase [Ignavibacteriaceae bacterium]|nr:glutamyl-tRNA reductase [Ignavibacteriaceae bacterium]
MNLSAISINHHSASVDLREALHLSEEEIAELVAKIKGNVFSEGLVISTCNRTEIYGFPVNDKLLLPDIQKILAEHKSVKNISAENFQTFHSFSAIEHLFRVATGIDSMLIGDNQIFKQVKDSFQLAEDLSFTGVISKRIFDAAIKTGKRAINETLISEGAVTVSYAAVQLIEKIFSNLSKKSALVIGAGETGEIAAKHLRDRGIGRLSITNRTIERAEKIGSSLNAKILPFSKFKEFIHDYDIIISATSAPELILSKTDIENAMKHRNYSAMVLMDIAVPRDIDPASKKIEYVFYHDIDSLNIIVEQNLAKRREEIPKVEKIITEELDALMNWYHSLEAGPTIKSLRDYFEAVRAEEISKNKNRFSDDDQEKLDIITKRIINKILHQPMVELKKLSDNDSGSNEMAARISILREIFGIDKTKNKEENKE